MRPNGLQVAVHCRAGAPNVSAWLVHCVWHVPLAKALMLRMHVQIRALQSMFGWSSTLRTPSPGPCACIPPPPSAPFPPPHPPSLRRTGVSPRRTPTAWASTAVRRNTHATHASGIAHSRGWARVRVCEGGGSGHIALAPGPFSRSCSHRVPLSISVVCSVGWCKLRCLCLFGCHLLSKGEWDPFVSRAC